MLAAPDLLPTHAYCACRYAAPVSVSILMEQFESLLSPSAKVATPDQQQAAAAHAAWVELQAQTAAKK